MIRQQEYIMLIEDRSAQHTSYHEIYARAQRFGASVSDRNRLAKLDEDRLAHGRAVLAKALPLGRGSTSWLLAVALTPIIHPKGDAISKMDRTPRLLAALEAVNLKPSGPLAEWAGEDSAWTSATIDLEDGSALSLVVGWHKGWHRQPSPWVYDYAQISVMQPAILGGGWHLMDECTLDNKGNRR
jgi:hypothetical protein